ncbi:MAG: hypothetical protein ABGX16_21255, partial [Pirellulales bacterium]
QMWAEKMRKEFHATDTEWCSLLQWATFRAWTGFRQFQMGNVGVGKKVRPNATTLHHFQETVRKYLSTEDVYWTIVESCDICGPFENWHPKLSLVDLPGTNDTDPHRSAVTNSLRTNSQAIAILTSDSNLGYDIQSWLQNSTVLGDFLEAKDSRRQRLFIIRSKLDDHLPPIDPDKIDETDEESEQKLRRLAMEQYKDAQSTAYHNMLKDIVVPMLPSGLAGENGKQKRSDLLDRVTKIPVFFVSSQAHAAFANRLKATKRDLRNLKEDFYDDPSATGLPGLRNYLNDVAADYLAKNHYEDIETRLESEVSQLALYFQKESRTVQAELAGAGESVRALIVHVEKDVIPWIGAEVQNRVTDFRQQANRGSNDIRQRLDQVWAMSERRFQDKIEKWSNYAWNSLRATARKDGTHTRYDGAHIDINQDICSVLVDDLILAWTSYRDYLIDERIDELTDDFAKKLQDKLRETSHQTNNPDAKAAIADILTQLDGITYAQRHDLLRQVNTQIRQFESIRLPAYNFIKETLKPTFQKIGFQSGQGCQQRMRKILVDGFQSNIGKIRDHISRLVGGNVDSLLDSCTSALKDFGSTAANRIATSVGEIAEMQQLEDRRVLGQRQQLLTDATKFLPMTKSEL